jgi:DNA ligase-1
MQAVLEDLFRRCIQESPADLVKLVSLLCGCIAPPQDAIELNVGDALLVKAIS